MLPEINITNPSFKVFQSSVVGSMQEAERKRKKKEPTRLKNVKHTQNKDKYSSTSKDTVEKERPVEQIPKEQKKKRQKQTRHANMHYAASAYKKQRNLNKKIDEKKAKPIVEI